MKDTQPLTDLFGACCKLVQTVAKSALKACRIAR
jgi:hypothetical protein